MSVTQKVTEVKGSVTAHFDSEPACSPAGVER